MIPPWRERLAVWICARIGHRPAGERSPYGWRTCRRCRYGVRA